MKSRTVGTSVVLSELGLGAAQFGNLNRETTDEASREAVAEAWAAGVRMFDTAPHYGLGLSERRLGAALADYPRDDYVISTKVGRLLEASPSTASERDGDFVVPATHRRRWDFSRDGILRSLEQSLERLGLERIDIVYLHDCDDHWQQASTEAAATLSELRDQGVIRAWGAGLNQSAMTAEFIRRCDVDVMMLAGRYTLLDRGALADALPAAAERGVSIVAAGVYNSGLLSSPVVSDDAMHNYRAAPPEVIERAKTLARICADFRVTLPHAALQFPLRHPQVASVVVGMRTARHVRDAVAYVTQAVPDELWHALDAADLIDIDPPTPKATS